MNPETIKARVAAREQAKTVCDLVIESADSVEDASEYWQEVKRLLAEWLPERKRLSTKTILPMSKDEARRFEQSKIPFGMYSGKTVGEMVVENGQYLDWLIGSYEDQQAWFDLLRRYLLNPDVVAIIPGDES